MARPKRTPAQRAADLLWLQKLYLRGTKDANTLARMLNAEGRPYRISGKQIEYDIADLKKRWLATVAEEMGTARAAQLQALDDQEAELWEAWVKSKQDAVTQSEKVKRRNEGTTGKKGAKKQDVLAEVSTEAEKASKKVAQTGDPAFQDLILKVRARRAKLLGIDAPLKQEFSGPEGGPIAVDVEGETEFDMSGIDQFLEKVYAQRQAAKTEQPSQTPTG